MSLSRQIPILIALLLCYAICVAQRAQIDSLKKLLSSLKDSARVDCLNALSSEYLKLVNDTAKYYIAKAYEESKKINYIHGIAEALSCKGEAELDIEEDFPTSEKLSHEAIEWYRKTPNKKRLAETYFNFGFVLYAESYFTEAIKNLDTAYQLCKRSNDKHGMFWSIFVLGHIYDESGNYERAFELDSKGLAMAIENNDDEFRRNELYHMAGLFLQIGDYKTALEYYRQGYESIKPYPLDFAKLFTLQQQFDSAQYYYNLADTSDPREVRFYLASIGEFYLARKQYDKALPHLLRSLNDNKERNDRNQIMRLLMDIAKTYLALKNNTAAFEYAKEGLNMAKQTGAKQFIRDGNQILYSLYDATQQVDSANYYYRQYIVMRDSILNDQVKAKLIAYGPLQKIALLSKEKEIQQVQLQKESLWRKFLIIGIIVLVLLATIIVRVIMLKRKNEAQKREIAENQLHIQKLESKKKEDTLKQQASELEMQALRAQMNPHFIFNSLNSINRFILKKQSSEATEYLTKFSRLIRMILNSSASASVSLAEDLEALQLYLELESLRFDNQFSYKIECNPDVDTEFIHVPPMLLQPFVENAIWHGLMNKEGEGHLWININQEGSTLICTIIDDGIGRQRAAELKSKSSKHKSMGMNITESRIAMLQRMNENKPVEIKDLVDADGSAAGTEVIIKIPVVYD